MSDIHQKLHGSIAGDNSPTTNIPESLLEAFSSAPTAISLLDATHHFVFVNRETEKLLSKSSSDLLGSCLTDHLQSDSQNQPLDSLMVSAAEDNSSFDVRVIHNDTPISISPRLLKLSGIQDNTICYITPVNKYDAHQQVVSDILTELISLRPLKEVLTQVTRLLVSKTGADHATVTLLDNGERNFVFEAEYPPLSEPSIVGKGIPVNGMPTQERLLLDRQPLIIQDVTDHPISHESSDVAQLVSSMTIESEVIVPLVFKDKVIGTIGIDFFAKKRAFHDEDISMYVTIANQVAIAIENARLFESDETLRRIYREAETGKSLTETASHWLDRLRGIVDYRTASLQLIVGSSRTILDSRGFDRTSASPDLLPRIDRDQLVRDTIDSGNILIIADTSTSPLWGEHVGTSQVKSWLGIPLVCGDGINGIITLDHDDPGHFGKLTDDDIDRLDSFAGAAASEIRDAFLFHAGGRHVRAFSIVSAIAELVGARVGTEEILASFAKEVSTGLGGDFCCVFLQVDKPSGSYLKPRGFWPNVNSAKPNCIDLSNADARDPIVNCYWRALSTESCGTVDGICATLPWVSESLILQPVVAAGRCLGVVVVGAGAPGAFRESDELLLGTLSRLVAHALEREAGLEQLRSIGNTRVAKQPLGAVLSKILEAALHLTLKQQGVIFLLDESCSRVEHSVSFPEAAHPAPRINDSNSVSARLLSASHDSVIDIPDTRLEPRVKPELREAFGSMAGAKLSVDDRVVGLMFLNGEHPRALTANQRTFLSRLAEEAAITIEHVRLTEQLRNAEAEYHSLVDHVPVCVYRKDNDSVIVSANKAYCDSVGRDPDSIRGCTDFTFYPEQIAQKYVRDDKRVLNGESISQDEEHVRPADGRRIWVRVNKTPVLDGNGVIVGTQGMFWDITEEKEADARASEYVAQYESLIRQSPNGIVALRDGRVTLANDAAARMIGVDTAKMLDGLTLPEVLTLARVSDVEKTFQQLTAAHEAEVSFTPKGSDTSMPVVINAIPLDGQAAFEQVVFYDVTKHEQLLKDIDHRVKNNLTSVASLMALQKDRFSEAHIQMALQESIDRVHTMIEIHDELLSGQIVSSFQTVDLRNLLLRLAARLDQVYGSTGVTLANDLQHVRLGADVASVCAMAASELIVNALKHAFPVAGVEGNIKVQLVREGEHVILAVEDNGCGLSGHEKSVGLKLVVHYAEKRLRGECKFLRSESQQGTRVEIRFRETWAEPRHNGTEKLDGK